MVVRQTESLIWLCLAIADIHGRKVAQLEQVSHFDILKRLLLETFDSRSYRWRQGPMAGFKSRPEGQTLTHRVEVGP
jgi:hypothetical protein